MVSDVSEPESSGNDSHSLTRSFGSPAIVKALSLTCAVCDLTAAAAAPVAAAVKVVVAGVGVPVARA